MKQLAVITGGTKGIGKALVTKFLSAGLEVVTCSRNENDLEALKAETRKIIPGKLRVMKADISLKEEAIAFAEMINSLPLTPDLLINNTGTYIPGQIHNEEDGVFERLLQTNLHGAYYLTRALCTKMMARKSGHIFNICSTASITPYVNGGSYCISKYALYGMTKVLREEMKPFGIRVTAVLPGATFTSSWEGTPFPPSRFIKPDDVAEAIFSAWMLSKNTVVEELLIRPQEGDIV